MKTATLEQSEPSSSGRLADFSQLIKARLTFLVLVSTAVGFYVAAPTPIDWSSFGSALIGAALAAAGASALNQWWERNLDAMMLRTRSRPVPAGRMRPKIALMLGCACSIAGVFYLALRTNLLAATLTALTVLIYVFAYTPLKRVSTANTLVGAIPGALPPLIGWAAARGTLDFASFSLFLILFIWQLPHFFAIAWICRDDYERAGFRMLASGDESGARSASQSVLFCIVLLLIAGIPTFIALVSWNYLLVELILGIIFVVLAFRFHQTANLQNARRLFFWSIIYLPLLLGTLVLTKL